MKFDTVLFDLDGTLTDSFVGISNAVGYALDRMGVARLSDSVLKKFIGPPLSTSFGEYLGFGDDDVSRALGLYREYYSATGKFENRVYDGVPQMLGALAECGLKLYVATSKPEPFAVDIVENFGLSAYITRVFGASVDGSRIEKSDVVRYATETSGADEKRAVMVGDRKFDIIGAKDNRLSSVGVLYGYGGRDELVNAGADFIAATPADVVKAIKNA